MKIRHALLAAVATIATVGGLPGAASATPNLNAPLSIADGYKVVNNLRTTYVEQIAPNQVYVEFNTRAEAIYPVCKRSVRTDCANPRTGSVRLEDGSRVHLARWVR